MKFNRSVALVAASVSLVSCGGGDGNGASSPSPEPTDSAPVFTSAGSVSVVENTEGAFYSASASDADGDAITLSLYSGADADRFVLGTDGALSFNTAPNYDKPEDADFDNVYAVTLRATAGGKSTNLNLQVRVTNDREGVFVERLTSGFTDPVGMAFIHNRPELLVAEKGGAVFRVNEDTGETTELAFVREKKRAGEILAITYAFPDDPYQEGIYLVTHDPVDGLYLQAFHEPSGRAGARKLAEPWSSPTTASLLPAGNLYVAVGSPQEGNAQDASTAYGKLLELYPYNPYAGASLPPPDAIVFSMATIGDGLQRPGGMSPEYDRIYVADRGSSRQNEISIIRPEWRPLDFGWPFYEGSEAVRENPPAQVVGPTLAYTVGTGRLAGEGVVAGLINDYNFLPALGSSYIFADIDGTIWSVPYSTVVDGYLHFADDFERKTEDFAPEVGSIDSPVAISAGAGTSKFFLLDNDGEVFEIRQAD